MDSERLIEEVRKYPVLYDQSNDKYRHVEYKERIWKIISKNVGAEAGVEECKRRWNSIRDQLRRTIQRRKAKSGTPAEKRRKYKYEDILTFLLPHMSEIDGSTIAPPEANEGNDVHERLTDSQDTQDVGKPCKEEIFCDVNEYYAEDEQGPTDITGMVTDSPVPRTAKKKVIEKHEFASPSSTDKRVPGREGNAQDTPASQLMAYILAQKETTKVHKRRSQNSAQDPVDAFLCCLAPTLKSLNPFLLNEAKGKIFAIVQELEVKQLEMNASGEERYLPSYSMPLSQSSACSSPSSASTSSKNRCESEV